MTQVLRDVPEHHEGPLYWRADGDIMVHTGPTTVARMHRSQDLWHEVEHLSIPKTDATDIFGPLTSSGTNVLGVHTNVRTPDDLFVFEPGQNQIRLITNLNPQMQNVKLAPVKIVH